MTAIEHESEAHARVRAFVDTYAAIYGETMDDTLRIVGTADGHAALTISDLRAILD